jgi:hypothetical protein
MPGHRALKLEGGRRALRACIRCRKPDADSEVTARDSSCAREEETTEKGEVVLVAAECFTYTRDHCCFGRFGAVVGRHRRSLSCLVRWSVSCVAV